MVINFISGCISSLWTENETIKEMVLPYKMFYKFIEEIPGNPEIENPLTQEFVFYRGIKFTYSVYSPIIQIVLGPK